MTMTAIWQIWSMTNEQRESLLILHLRKSIAKWLTNIDKNQRF